MSNRKKLIVMAGGAGFDLLASARILMLYNQDAILLMPKRLAQNAWEYAKRQFWFKPVPLRNIFWNDIDEILMLGISAANDNIELISILGGKNINIVSWSSISPRLPFHVEHIHCLSQSLTSFLYLTNFSEVSPQSSVCDLPANLEKIHSADKHSGRINFSQYDLTLFLIAVTEKTWCGMSSKATDIDHEALFKLRKSCPNNKTVASTVFLPFREGQKGLFKDIMSSVEDTEIKGHPLMMSIVSSPGNIQDVSPVLCAAWSQLDPFMIILAIVGTTQCRIWARSRIRKVNLKKVFRNHPFQISEGWIHFSIYETDVKEIKKTLLNEMFEGITQDDTASHIMTAFPITVESSDSVAQTLELMLKYHLMGLIVTEEARYCGIITRRDLDRAVQMNLMDSPIKPFIPDDYPFVSPETPLSMIRSLMIIKNISRIAVVDNQMPAGIITSRDIIRLTEEPYPYTHRFMADHKNILNPSPADVEKLFRKIAPVSLLTLLKKIGETAQNVGFKTFLVGGFVRDLLLELPNHDLDVVIIGDAMMFSEKLKTDLNAEIHIHERFGTASLVHNDLRIDFTTARIEHYSKVGALPEVQMSGIANDLARRDFTINSMALSLHPDDFFKLFDYFGGLNDLQRKKIRILNTLSFFEDPTRIFRALRFASRLHFELSSDTRNAFELALSRNALETLSKKRIASEIAKCFSERFSARVLEKIFMYGIIKSFHPGLKKFGDLPERFCLLKGIIRRFSVFGEPIVPEAVYWTGLLFPLPVKDADNLMKESCIHSTVRKITASVLSSINEVTAALAKISADDSWSLYKLLSPLPIEAYIALTAFTLDKCGIRKIFRFITLHRKLKPSISGTDLIKLGFTQGPVIKNTLDEITREIVLNNIKNRNQELDYAKRKYEIFSVNKCKG
ncbi:MAG: CBS domain-containing protein [Candidatus Riflebacteria bacterium]|nr:CBS domain-containing protein [Candidatus Riflebacteria bacterium]